MRAAIRTFRYQVAESVLQFHGSFISVDPVNMVVAVSEPILVLDGADVVGVELHNFVQTGDEVTVWPCPTDCQYHGDERNDRNNGAGNLRQ